MDIIKKRIFNKWAYFMDSMGYTIIGYKIKPFLMFIPTETKKDE